MTALDQIRASAAQGLTAAEIEAGIIRRPMTDAERTAYHAARGVWKLREAKRKADKRASVAMTGAERVAKFREGAAAIDAQLAEARANVNVRRRDAAEKSLAAWIRTYGIGVFIDDEPSKHGDEILHEMESAANDSRPYQILIARGHGKTSYAEAFAAYSIATGRRKFVLISSINAKQAQQILSEIERVFTSDPFAQDYPDIAIPLLCLDGHCRRMQKQAGHDTEVRIVTGEVHLPVITNDDGSPSRASGAVIKARALKSVRGTKNGTTRPDLVILDDLQTREIAENGDRVAGVLNLVRGDVMGLAGKNKAAIISTATSIAPDDLTDALAADRAWKTTKFKAVIKWPDEWLKDGHGLWGRYLSIFDDENAQDLKHTRRGGSLSFYRSNRAKMDAGADILSWSNYSRRDGQISGLQKLIDKYREMGHNHFMAEYQMEPVRNSFAVDVPARLIMSRVRAGVPQGTLIENRVFTCAATDINPSYGLTTTWSSFDVNRTCLIGGYHITPIKIDDSSNDTAFHASIYNALGELARNLKTAGVAFDAWGIDAGGKQFQPVTRFAHNAEAQFGIRAVAMTGRAGRNWNPNVRSKIRAALNETVWCRDPRTGFKWLAWNADFYKESFQKMWLSEVGADGGASLFDGDVNHSQFANQCANEKLIDKRALPGGFGYSYKWKSKDPHDYLDVCAMMLALAGADGLNGDGCRTASSSSRREAVCL